MKLTMKNCEEKRDKKRKKNIRKEKRRRSYFFFSPIKTKKRNEGKQNRRTKGNGKKGKWDLLTSSITFLFKLKTPDVAVGSSSIPNQQVRKL